MAYCQVSDVKEALDITTDKHNARIAEFIEVASDWIDKHCRYHGVERPFEIPQATTRYFDSIYVSGQFVVTDVPFISVDSVVNGDGAVIPATEYVQVPRNHPRSYQIRLKNGTAWAFADSDSEIAMTAKWGYSEIAPANVAEACRYMAGWSHQRWQAGLNTSSSTSDFGTVRQVTNVPEYVKTLLEPCVDYRRVL